MFVGVSPVWGIVDGVGTAPLPYQARIVFAGDSLTTQGFSGTAGSEREVWTTRGYAPWAQMFSGHRAYAGSKANKGVSGNTSTQLLARFADVLSDNPALLVILIGTNDIGLGLIATIKSNVESMIAQCRAIGCRMIISKIWPRGSVGAPMNGTQISEWEEFNSWLPTKAASDLIVVDTDPVLGAGDANHTILPQFTPDNLHLNSLGAATVGPVFAAAINLMVTSGEYRASSDATNDLIVNGFFAGTAGTASNGATGTVADGWTVTAAAATSGGATLAVSKGTDPDSVGASQIINASGTYTGSNRFLRVQRGLTLGSPFILTDEYWQLEVTASIQPGYTSNITSLGGFVSAMNLQIMANTLNDAWPLAGTFRMRSLPWKAAADVSSTNFWAQAAMLNTAGTDPVTAEVGFSRFEMKKVTA